MKIYIAARFSKRPEANRLAHMLIVKHHTITSRWVKPECDHVMPTGLSSQAKYDERQKFAKEDLDDIDACDWMISLTEKPRGNGRGGRHVEFGYALASGKILTIIGPRETVFHHLQNVEHFYTIYEFIKSRQLFA